MLNGEVMALDVSLPYHRKYRPKTLKDKDYVGNKKLKKSAMTALASNPKPQVILLQGTAGTGKTSMARLLGKEYLCENRDIEKGACGVCFNCKAVDEYIETGRSDVLMNIREVDAADNNKRQDIDDILEDAMSPSFDGNWKIYILDECHKLSDSAQNRLLKTLEEPPEKVLIILCTTEPEQLLPTIISRCQYIFQVQKPSLEEMVELLKKVCKSESIKYDLKSLGLVATKGDFVPRDTLIALESVVNEIKELTYEKTVEALDIIAEKYFFEFFDILLENRVNTNRYINFIGRLKLQMDLKVFVNNLIVFVRRALYVSNGVIVDGLDISEIKQYKSLFKKFTSEELSYLIETLLDIKYSKDMETKLLVLGFKGLKNNSLINKYKKDSVELLDNADYSASEEKAIGDENYLDSVTMTEDEKENIIKDLNKPMDINEIASMFGGTVIKTQ